MLPDFMIASVNEAAVRVIVETQTIRSRAGEVIGLLGEGLGWTLA